MPTDFSNLPSIKSDAFAVPAASSFQRPAAQHRPRILLLYGSLRGPSAGLPSEAARLPQPAPKIFRPAASAG
jgi:hypothetical protein